MFTLSDKTRVLNSPAEVRVFSAANVERVTSATIAGTDRLWVEGFGDFDVADITYIKLRRARLATQNVVDWAVVAPGGIAVGDSIEVILSVKTSRYQSEILVQNSIGGGRTIKFQTPALTAITTVAIEAAIVAGYNNFVGIFPNYAPIISVTTGTAVGDSTIRTLGDLEGSLTVNRVELRRINTGIPPSVPISLVPTLVTPAYEGSGLGKFLEESVSMATSANTDPYGVDNASTGVDLRGKYTEIIFNVNAPFTENLATNGADYGSIDGIDGPAVAGVPANHSFALFVNEGTSIATDSAIDKLAAIAVLRSTALAYLTNTVQAAPLTLLQEETEVLIIADGSSVATTAAFIV